MPPAVLLLELLELELALLERLPPELEAELLEPAPVELEPELLEPAAVELDPVPLDPELLEPPPPRALDEEAAADDADCEILALAPAELDPVELDRDEAPEVVAPPEFKTEAPEPPAVDDALAEPELPPGESGPEEPLRDEDPEPQPVLTTERTAATATCVRISMTRPLPLKTAMCERQWLPGCASVIQSRSEQWQARGGLRGVGDAKEIRPSGRSGMGRFFCRS